MSAPARAVRIDVAAVLDELHRVDDAAVSQTAMDRELLDAARQCASGRASQPPRRELVAVALRAADRSAVQAARAEAQLALAQSTRDDLLRIQHELVGFLATQLACDPDPRVVLARVRARRPSLERALVAGAVLPAAS